MYGGPFLRAALIFLGFLSVTFVPDACLAATVESFDRFFSLDLPEGYRVVGESPVDDFILYRIQKDSETVATVYVGNAPSYSREKRERKRESAELQASNVNIFTQWIGSAIEYRSILVQLRSSGWPMYIHAVASSPSTHTEKILFSLKVRSEPK